VIVAVTCRYRVHICPEGPQRLINYEGGTRARPPAPLPPPAEINLVGAIFAFRYRGSIPVTFRYRGSIPVTCPPGEPSAISRSRLLPL
jgi:hypothetical protein